MHVQNTNTYQTFHIVVVACSRDPLWYS